MDLNLYSGFKSSSHFRYDQVCTNLQHFIVTSQVLREFTVNSKHNSELRFHQRTKYISEVEFYQ